MLTGIYLKLFNFFDTIFNPLLNILKKVSYKMRVGNGIAVDMSQFILLLLLLMSLKFFI